MSITTRIPDTDGALFDVAAAVRMRSREQRRAAGGGRFDATCAGRPRKSHPIRPEPTV